MRTDWVPREEIQHILAALTPPNRLACEVSMRTGLRIGDVLRLKTSQLKNRFTIQEEKTGKCRRVFLSDKLLNELLENSGKIFVFPHRTNGRKHRTRQAVFKDLKRAAGLFRCREKVRPHSLRKIYAVEQYEKTKDLARVKRLLNHSSEAVTYIYAMADLITKKGHLTKKKI